MSRGLRVVSAVLLLLCLRPLQAADPGCPDAELFSGKLITDICWGCLFPIRIAGLSIGGGDRPAAASDQVVCACNDGLGIPHPGFVVSLWEPARIVELTRAPACSPALGGIRLPLGSRRLLGTAGKSEWDASDISFYNYHWYAFPLLTLLDLFFEDRCNADGMVDFDILYLSELDPTWNSGELAFFTNPEAAWLANPVALAACLADAASATAGTPIDALFWCAGTWGLLYPFSGAMPNYGSRPSETSLSAARALGGAASARARPPHHGRRRPVQRPHRSLPHQVPVPDVHVLPPAGDPVEPRHRRERLPLGRVALAARSGGGPPVSLVALE